MRVSTVPVVERLPQHGHDVVYVAEANARSAVLLTADKDFGELVFRQGLVHSGVVLLRLAGLAQATKAAIVAEVCRDRTAELIGAFSVVSTSQVLFGKSPDEPCGWNLGIQARGLSKLQTP
jgi:predicted nuclease of predicted toxin-antitoxin system